MSLTLLEAIGAALAVAAAAFFFHLYSQQLTANGGLQQSVDQLTHAQQDKANAQKSRATIEHNNSSADYPALINKL